MATWLVSAVINEFEPTSGARANEAPAVVQQELADHELQRFNNRAEADRRQVQNLQRARQELADRELQRFNNRAEADRRQVEILQEQQRTTDPGGDPGRS